MSQIARALRIVSGMSAVLATCACTMVRIETPSKDDVEVSTRFGIVNVELKPGARAVLVESTSLGAMNGFDGFSFGYRSSTVAALHPGDCRIVLWIQTDEQLKELNQLLRDRSDVCVVPAKSSKGGTP